MNILCFGDSNTHGHNPKTGKRHARDVRFTGILQKELGDEFYIIEEGLGGRTTFCEDTLREGMCALDYIVPCMLTHTPLDLVVVMLGTNDTKERFGANAEVICRGMKRLLKKMLNVEDCFRDKQNILLVSPPIIKDNVRSVNEAMGSGCEEKSQKTVALFEKLAEEMGIFYLSASDYAEFSDIDKMHLDAEGHRNLADALKVKILEIKEVIG